MVSPSSEASGPDTERPVIAVGLLRSVSSTLWTWPARFHETPYLGIAYCALITASLATAIDAADGSLRRWRLWAILVAARPTVGYVMFRSVGLPDATGNIGNWLEPSPRRTPYSPEGDR